MELDQSMENAEEIPLLSNETPDTQNKETPQNLPNKDKNVVTISSDEGPKTLKRLMIYKIELNNFKSYAGKKEIGPLHKCFSTVVGPNGSGKSNLIESLLFVFGYRMKKIRSDKISSIIHKSEKYDSIHFASVSVYFQTIIDYVDDETKYEPVKDSQFVISRIGFRDNKSKYYHGNEECKLSDVVRILKEKGIDLEHNRFLILQGEVEMIAQMKPKGTGHKEVGFLEFLEEIIGSHKYVPQIEYLSGAIEE